MTMKVTLLQRDIVWASPAVNVERADMAIDEQPGADLYVLPEMFSTGFATDPQGIAEGTESETLQWMKRKAVQTSAALAGSLAVTDGTHYYNRFYFVEPNGRVTTADKHHLFTYGGEDKRFTSGAQRTVVQFRGVRILLLVCYDLRFPVWSRNRGDYDMIIYVASWPTSRVDAWNMLLHARAIENQCYVAAVNRVGSDPSCDYCGGTFLIDPYGKDVALASRGVEEAISGEVDMQLLRDFRMKFPALNDADEFDLK